MSETGSDIIDLREKERDKQTNYVTNQEVGLYLSVCLFLSQDLVYLATGLRPPLDIIDDQPLISNHLADQEIV